MEKNRVKVITSMVACFLMPVLVSCLKSSDAVLPSTDVQVATDQEHYESYLCDADDMVDLAVNAQKEIIGEGRLQEAIRPADDRFSCAALTLTFSEDNSKDVPHGNLLIDFGDSCSDAKGADRKGKISVEFKGKRFAIDSYVNYTFEKYAIYDVMLEGERKMTVTQIINDNNFVTVTMSLLLKNGKAKWTDNTAMTLSTQQVREWIHDKLNTNYDQWQITGSSSGTTRGGRTFSAAITEPLFYNMKCIRGDIRVYLPDKGKVNLTVSGDAPMMLDFGKGECDTQFIVSKNGVSVEVRHQAGK